MLRSGIGPGAELLVQGIDVLADRPGVGANLMAQPSIAVSAVEQSRAATGKKTVGYASRGWQNGILRERGRR
ncbi:GMC family oxidoreductase N-terminal domain-containing protein [Phytopseudomonas flavescens]|uniref:GMC family oxidoreductase N-terminal domain-containing protein n=1 Tax=Phytopseudomonas flavescens TaxID=29435 RepID=UPI000A6BE3B3|nr:GMC family oxidoreductase N-terminal domain-containing protein [Pseudomonas flavescens]